MRQLLQNLKTGELEIAELPCPLAGPGTLLVQTRASLISAGTERMLVEFSKANLIQKARQQPEKVKQILDKIRTDGLMPTLEAVFRKLDEPLPLGYCSAGVVLEIGAGVREFRPGDRVASNAPHAEIACVPRNLCAKIPDGVTIEQAAFTTLASIALQGVRLAQPTLGEKFMVIGLGLLGLLAVQLLRANGCDVLAVDLIPERLALAESLGARTVNVRAAGDPVAAAYHLTDGKGVDGVLITASAKTDEIMHQAAQSCRKRGRIVLVGVVDLNLRRSDFYDKEITFQVSCSYGPGRYDEKYEQGGQDYPYGFVRWTEQRNFEAVLDLMRSGQLRLDNLITHRFPLREAVEAYGRIQHDPKALGVILEYSSESNRSQAVRIVQKASPAAEQECFGVIGAGNFAKAVLLPALAKTSARIGYVADINAAAAQHAARRFGAEQATTDYKQLLEAPHIGAVFVLVGHHMHARFVCEALEAGKHVFVEKPLVIHPEELSRVAEAVAKASDRIVMVGFNRRFSPHAVRMKTLLTGRSEPLCMTMTVNAGYIEPDHWVQDPERGGGRIIGEACHFLDLLSFLADSRVVTVSAIMVGEGPATREDKMSIVLGLADGSIGTVNYFGNGSRSYPKELLEVFSDGRVLRMENFRVTRGYGFRGFSKLKTFCQDKGHAAEVAAFVDHVRTGGMPLIPFGQMENVTLASFAAVESARAGKVVRIES